MQEYTKIDDLLEDLYQLISECKSGGFFGGKVLDKDEAFNILEEIRYNLPRELKEAKKIIDNADKIIQDAQFEANKIVKISEDQAESLVSDHQITKMAREAEEIKRKEMKEFVTEMRDGAISYADRCLSEAEKELQASLNEVLRISKDLEEKLTREIDTIYRNRQEIKSEDLYGS